MSLSRDARRGARRMLTGRGFTLIELLVVVAIIALLIGILLPALGKARAAGWQATGASMQSQLYKGMSAYMASNEDWIPGVNTTGLGMLNNSLLTPDKLAKPHLPVQSFDWMTACIAAGELPDRRAARFDTLLERFADPAQKIRYAVPSQLYGGPADQDEFIELGTPKGGLQGISYLMPGPMAYAGRSIELPPDPVTFNSRYVQIGLESTPMSQFVPTARYKPRTDRMGQIGLKIAIADGFRYMLEGGDYDIDISINPSSFGSFTSNTPTYRLSREYSNDPTTPGEGLQVPLSYRHGGRMNATFFDGHGDTLDYHESQDPTLWAPSGYTINYSDLSEGSKDYYENGEKIN